jgi:hypothetical protein
VAVGGGDVMIGAAIESANTAGVMAPAVFIRGSVGDEALDDAAWTQLNNPVRAPWTVFQIRLVLPPRSLSLGDPFRVDLLETWVSPGPREAQVPELLLVAPSGLVHRVNGVPADQYRYHIDFAPDELGLWRYGWSFLPRAASPPGSHHGEGIFLVVPPTGQAEQAMLQTYAWQLVETFSDREQTNPSDQYKLNSFIRWAVDYGSRHPDQQDSSDELIAEVRGSLPNRFAE